MKDFKLHIILILLLMVITDLSGQPSKVNKMSARKLKRFAETTFRAGDIQTSLFYYERYHRAKPKNINATYNLAELYRLTRNYKRAEELYARVLLKAEKRYPKTRYYYGLMLKASGKYEDALNEFETFRKSYDGYPDERDMKKLARSEAEGCEIARDLIKKPVDASVDHMNSSINGVHVELSPLQVNDTLLLYSSLQVDSFMYFDPEKFEEQKPVRKFYYASKEGFDWTGGKEFPGPFNKPGSEVGNGTYTRDGKKFYFTRCTKNWQDRFVCNIFVSQYKDTAWSFPQKLPFPINLTNFTSTHPAIGYTSQGDHEVLYFVSDRDGGKGGYDIWYTVFDKSRNIWSKPRNPGTTINTPGDEMSPFYDPMSRTLYFSSSGLPGLGGLDIYYSLGERRNWSDPVNIGYPLNSSYDELYYTISPNKEDGYLVSNRPGGQSLDNETCCDDIYYYRWRNYIKIFVSGQIFPIEKDRFGRKKDYSNFDFFTVPDTIDPLNKAVIALYMIDTETKQKIFLDRDTTGSDGRYLFPLLPEKNYKFEMEGFQYFNEQVNLSTEFMNFSDTIQMPPIWVNVMPEKPIVLENVYYEFDKTQLTEDAKRVIDTTLYIMLTEAPEFIVEVSAHTDSVGSYNYNMQLSQDRAENVVRYLVQKGIDRNRLVAKGYGPTVPVAPNYNADGTDNEKGQQKNRRTEFRVVGTILTDENDLDEF